MNLRRRRIDNEARDLERLAESNGGRLSIEAIGESSFEVALRDCPARSLAGEIVTEHRVRIVFPPYYPAVPLEAFLAVPVRHANVHPENGFVCLWDRHQAGDTVIQGLLILQRVIAGELVNGSAEHVMQAEATDDEALPYEPLRVPPDYYLERSAGARPLSTGRKRLSRIE